MNIGFDAKRAFLNQSGLGNYSRTLIRSLATCFPDNHYSLFTTKNGSTDFFSFASAQKNCSVILPQKFIDKRITANWRSYVITELLTKNKIDVYHGLSNELPFNISKFKGKKIVTIHDLIFLRHPELYRFIDRKIYNKKFRSACELADMIIATSEQTKNDIVEFYSADPKKIKVVYQSCDDVFRKEFTKEETQKIQSKYKLPKKYLLSVGTIEKRKNLLATLHALALVKDIPLVVVGKKKSHFKKVKQFISKNKLQKRVLFLENVPGEDMPAIYRSAEIFIYPSLFEGFGIPILEALTCKTPVITTQGGCFAEAGGKDSIYIDPTNHELLAGEIKRLIASPELRKNMAEKGLEYSKKFLPEVIANEMMKIYTEK
jgi:glycosyltransferase involved in cell wall biosynthesis